MPKFDNKVDEFVYNSMLNYPSIFPDRAAVLTHALMVIGNAIHWNGAGGLSARTEFKTVQDAIDARQQYYDEQKQKHHNDDGTQDEFYDKFFSDMFNDDTKVLRAASRRAVKKIEPGSCKGGHYERQFGGYPNIYNLPLNIDDEWLAACYEMAEYVKSVNIYYEQMTAYFKLIEELRELDRAGKATTAIYKRRMKAILKECDVVYKARKAERDKEDGAPDHAHT